MSNGETLFDKTLACMTRDIESLKTALQMLLQDYDALKYDERQAQAHITELENQVNELELLLQRKE